MATLVFQAAGAALGSFVGGPVGAVIGRAAGGLAGAALDQALLAPSPSAGPPRHHEGPRLADLTVQASTEGSPIPRVYGRVRIAGQVIWATEFEEVARTSTQHHGGGGGKGGGGGSTTTTTTTTTYHYYANFAVGLCEGPVARVGRIWADGKPLDLSGVTMRVYPGDEEQAPDSLIEAKEGTGKAPAYRGLTYVVFERLPLERFGNRIPQLSFEVIRPVGELESRIRAVCVIPGASEFGYDTEEVQARLGQGVNRSENRHFGGAGTDFTESIDELQALCPELETVALIVTWFGDDLRCGECTVTPRVEVSDKDTRGGSWQVSGISRASAEVVSQVEDGLGAGPRPAFGGTPSDRSVVNAIQDLKARGLKVVFYPFLMMDVPEGNELPDPWTGASGQPAYPWRGRITCDPAPGEDGSPDGTTVAGDQVDAIFGVAQPGQFSASGETATYSGPAEWSWRRMVLHYAHLCAAAGGVDAFLIGSEFRALTHLRAGPGDYPAVTQLKTLAGDVRQVIGAQAEISYAADWSEYFGHQPEDGSGDVFFHLDPLWADPEIDFVGIDCYVPLSDWREGEHHLDAEIASGPYDRAYLRGSVAGGEGHDWFYETAADRSAQARTAITDGTYGKPWVFRYKDLVSWWKNEHYDRPGGVEAQAPTGWVPESKPIVLTEIGCPAIDKGANQPNVFFDPKSSESQTPYFSTGERDDLIQRRYLAALHDWWNPQSDHYADGANPPSAQYDGRAVDAQRMAVWAWDARPYPLFPMASDIWADGPNWQFGHWLNGRLGAAPLDGLVAAVAADYGLDFVDASALEGIVGGYVIDRPAPARAVLEPLMRAFAFDAVETGGALRMAHRGGAPVAVLTPDELAVAEADAPPVTRRRVQAAELPARMSLRYLDTATEHRPAAVGARRTGTVATAEEVVELPAAIDEGVARKAAAIMLQDVWTGRERADFALPPSRLALEAGDSLTLDLPEGARDLLITETAGALDRRVRTRGIDRRDYRAGRGPARESPAQGASALGAPAVAVIEPPLLPGTEPALYFAAFADPWPGAVEILVARPSGTHEPVALATAPASMGFLAQKLWPGPAWRWDQGNSILIDMPGAVPMPADPADVLEGSNAAAVRADNGEWEILQFAGAELVGENRYLLTMLLRGQAGSEPAMRAGASEGAPFVLLDEALPARGLTVDRIGLERSWRFVPAGAQLDGEAAVSESVSPAGVAFRPLAPVHVRGRRPQGSGDIIIAWTRRTRTGGDSWNAEDVPLGEDSEAYDLEVLDGETVVRSFSGLTEPQVTYTAAEQTADFGDPIAWPQSLDLRVYQRAASIGRGAPGMATLWFPLPVETT